MKKIKVNADADNGETANTTGEEGENGSAVSNGAQMSEQPNVPAVEEVDVSASNLSPEEELIRKLKDECAEYQDKYIRTLADLENFKKRATKERADLLRYSGESLARDLLEVVDTLQLATKQDSAASTEQMLAGIRLILDQFLAVLDRHSIRGEVAVGQPFDPNKHEALASVPTAEHNEGTVIEEFKRAYFFKDKLLRPAQVVVAKSASGD